MKFILLSLLFLSQLVLPLASFNKTEKEALRSASLEDIEYIFTGDVLTINDFVINESNFKEQNFQFTYSVTISNVETSYYYKVNIEITNGSGITFDNGDYDELSLVTGLANGSSKKYSSTVKIPNSLMNGEIKFSFAVYFSKYANFSSYVYELCTFNFSIHSYYDEAVEFEEDEIKLIYEVEYANSYLISRYETLYILGVEPVFEYPYYGMVPFYEFSFIYSLTSSRTFEGLIYYFVIDEENVLSHILDYELALDETYRGIQLALIENSKFDFSVQTEDFYLDTNTYKLSKTRTTTYNTKVNSIYFPKDSYKEFCYTSHIFYLSNFGEGNRDIYFKFFIDMDLVYLENGFSVEGGYGKVIDDYYQEEVII